MSVIFYRYDGSPFCDKLDNALALKKIPHLRVDVLPTVSARPEITDLLGVGYRRIPILAIGNDVYCDTSLIIPVLERRFPSGPDQNYGTIFPADKHGGGRNTGLLKAFSRHYGDTVLLTLSVRLLDWGAANPEMLEDRSKLFGSRIDPQKFAENRPRVISELSVHLTHIEQQLQDDREWLLDTISPSLADLSVHFIYAWIKKMPWFDPAIVDSLLDKGRFPR
ncbi:hypothetical protein V5O48_000837, partial [Marasmius crinis-equi]